MMTNEEIQKKIIPSLVNLKELLSTKNKYSIPIYQRPYDWDEWNITKIIETFNKLQNEKEFVFLGNMEFRKEKTDNQIIDGQQRITTTLMLLNYLMPEVYSDNVLLNMLKIKVQGENNTIDEQEKFKKFLKNKEYSKKEMEELENNNSRLQRKKRRYYRSENVYKLNYYYIKKAIPTEIKDIEQKKKFAEKILENTYVVIIKLHEKIGESEAIEIFDAINTTGKPLDTKDIFKIKMYEYAKKMTKKNPEEVIRKINKLYNEIEEKNNEITDIEKKIIDEERTGKSEYDEINIISEVFSHDDILKVYKYILIANVVNKKSKEEIAEYRSELFNMSNENFYNMLFQRILNNNSRKQFVGFEQENINEDELQTIFESYSKLADNVLNLKNINSETYFAYKMLKGYNRYRFAYGFLPVLYLWKFKKMDTDFDNFVINTSKIFEYYSIVNKQVINEVKRFVNNLIIKIVSSKSNATEINIEIEKKLKECNFEILKKELNTEIAKNWWNKNIACLILAKKAELENGKDILKKYQRLFTRKFDIEHICAIDDNDKRFTKNKNTLGNLMILEYTINRKIKKDKIEKKIHKYKDSKFQIVLNELVEINCGVKKYYKDYDYRQKRKVEEVKKYFE